MCYIYICGSHYVSHILLQRYNKKDKYANKNNNFHIIGYYSNDTTT